MKQLLQIYNVPEKAVLEYEPVKFRHNQNINELKNLLGNYRTYCNDYLKEKDFKHYLKQRAEEVRSIFVPTPNSPKAPIIGYECQISFQRKSKKSKESKLVFRFPAATDHQTIARKYNYETGWRSFCEGENCFSRNLLRPYAVCVRCYYTVKRVELKQRRTSTYRDYSLRNEQAKTAMRDFRTKKTATFEVVSYRSFQGLDRFIESNVYTSACRVSLKFHQV